MDNRNEALDILELTQVPRKRTIDLGFSREGSTTSFIKSKTIKVLK
jgi:hypothetical protein